MSELHQHRCSTPGCGLKVMAPLSADKFRQVFCSICAVALDRDLAEQDADELDEARIDAMQDQTESRPYVTTGPDGMKFVSRWKK